MIKQIKEDDADVDPMFSCFDKIFLEGGSQKTWSMQSFVLFYIGLVLYLFITVLFDLGEDLLFENQDKQPIPKFFGSKIYLAWASSQHCVFTSLPKRISDNT